MKEKIIHIFQSVANKMTQTVFPALKTKVLSVKSKTQAFFKKGISAAPDLKNKTVAFVLQWWHLLVGAFFAFIVLYYPVGALIVHRIDVNPDFSVRSEYPSPLLPATLSKLIGREISTNMFTPNKPFFYPAAILDNMPAFQTGVITGIKNITNILGVVNASSEELTAAAERLSYSPFVWHIENWKPAIASVKKYKKAQELLMEYQNKAAKEGFNHSKEAANSIISQIVQGLEDCLNRLEEQEKAGSEKMLDAKADELFYAVKGEAYVYLLTLKDMSNDFKEVFEHKETTEKLQKAETFLQKAVLMRPVAVVNGAIESSVIPNHLLNSGFYLSRTVSELKDLESIL